MENQSRVTVSWQAVELVDLSASSAAALQLGVVSRSRAQKYQLLCWLHLVDNIQFTGFVRNIAWRHQRHVISSIMNQVVYDMLYKFLALSSHEDLRSMQYVSIRWVLCSKIPAYHIKGRDAKVRSRFGSQAHKAHNTMQKADLAKGCEIKMVLLRLIFEASML